VTISATSLAPSRANSTADHRPDFYQFRLLAGAVALFENLAWGAGCRMARVVAGTATRWAARLL
jgi:hypothetical protein